MQKHTFLGRFLIWRIKHISNTQFIYFLSIIVGLATGLSAVIIKNTVHLIQLLLTFKFANEYQNYLYFAYPMAGILITILIIKYLIKHPINHGIPSVLHAISKRNGVIRRNNIYSSAITSSVTVGFGGSVGLEGPTIATGAAIGSNLGRLVHLDYKQIILLIACGCAGALSSLFNAPIAAIVFALEVIMIDLTMSSLIPLLVASATAALTSYFFLGQDVLYSVEIKDKFIFTDFPFYILLGVFGGFISLYFSKTYFYINGFFAKIKKKYLKVLIGGTILGLLIFIMPSLFGEGYNSINSCLSGDFSYLFNHSLYYSYHNSRIAMIIIFISLVFFKAIATSITFGSGGVGGIFAPTLFIGANTGFLFAFLLNYFGLNVSVNNFALVGMAALISGVIHAPLTAIFLIAELTKGYELFLPLMITSTISYATIRLFEKNSVYTKELAQRGELITHDKDKAVLSFMKVENQIESNFLTINPDASLRDLVSLISKSTRNIYPVVDTENNFLGIVFLDHIRHIMFNQELYDITFVRDLMFNPTVVVYPHDTMEDVAQKFQDTGNFNLPVIENGKYLGFVSRAHVFSSYRRLLKNFSEE